MGKKEKKGKTTKKNIQKSEKKKRTTIKEKNAPKEKKKHVTVLQFVPNHRYAIHVWKIVPRNHAVVICSDIFSHVYGSCRFHVFIVHVVRSGAVLPFFPRGFYSITATQFMFGIWWPPMFTCFYLSLCVLLFSFMVYFISWCLLMCYLFSFTVFSFISIIFISSYLFSFLFIFVHFLFLFFSLEKPLPI